MALGQNGYKTNSIDPSFPHQEVGEDVLEMDLCGQRADATSRIVWFKAFAGVSAGPNVKLAASGIAPMDKKKGGTLAFAPWLRGATPTPLPANMTGLKPGMKLYLSVTTPGSVQITKPVTVGQLVQEVGEAFWEGERMGGINAGEDANSIRWEIKPALQL